MAKVCKDCQDRYPACWGSCPDYLAARAERDEAKRRKYEARMTEIKINSVQYHGLDRYKKRRR